MLFANFSVIVHQNHGAVKGSLNRSMRAIPASICAMPARSSTWPATGLAAAQGQGQGQGQQKLYEFVKLMQGAGVSVKFAVHPLAGRMPGQTDVLLAEAGVPCDMIFQLDDVNSEFTDADVAPVVGANDVVNPAARTDKASPTFGMPILTSTWRGRSTWSSSPSRPRSASGRALAIDLNKALYWSAVINSMVSAPIVAAMVLMAARADIMGPFVIGKELKVPGWLATRQP
ncbi:NAD(P)(+) transhydrogenase (Re/Si-specific) subunit beta [Cupriavidus sp. 2TAF22]|uniref:NAD(P)(+) transhydrogenase (Re/Si-specific) subunit beta n=1 Tax=unclassified Cupriavidus TaxID=2640874 RepID=UPI003F8DD40A